MIHIARVAGVAWVGALCFAFAYIVSSLLNKMTPALNKEKAKWKTFFDVFLQFAIIGAIVYGSRLFITKLPFPFEGIHSQLGEVRSLPLLVFIFMFFQTKTQDKMRWITYS